MSDSDQLDFGHAAPLLVRPAALGAAALVLGSLEARLARSRKLESLGQFAVGIAHEVNTPMQCVSSNVDFLTSCYERTAGLVEGILSKFNPPHLDWRERRDAIEELLSEARYEMVASEAPAALEDAHEASRRVIEIVRAMKALSHPGSEIKTATNVNEVLRNRSRIARNRWKYDATLTPDLDPSEPTVARIEAELSQVFLKLIVNAADAIAEKRESGDPLGEIKLASCLLDESLPIEAATPQEATELGVTVS